MGPKWSLQPIGPYIHRDSKWSWLAKTWLLCSRSFRCSWMTWDTWMKTSRSSWQSLTGGTTSSSQSWMSWGLCWTRLNERGSWQSMSCWKPLNVWTCCILRLAFPGLNSASPVKHWHCSSMGITRQTLPACLLVRKWRRGNKPLCICAPSFLPGQLELMAQPTALSSSQKIWMGDYKHKM